MARTSLTTPRPQFRDFFGKSMTRLIPNLIKAVDRAYTVQEELNLELKQGNSTYRPDFVARIILDITLYPWNLIHQLVSGFACNMEYVDRLRRSQAKQIRTYRALIRAALPDAFLLLTHHIFVIGPTNGPRPEEFIYDVDSFGQPITASVHYMDALCLRWVPLEELALAAGLLLQAIQLDLRSPAMTRRAVVAIVWEPDPDLRFELLQNICCCVNIWPELSHEFAEVLHEEIEAMPAVTRKKMREETIDAFVSFPEYHSILERKYLTPERRKGREEGLEKGRKEGLDKGRKEGLDKGREEGLDKGREENHVNNLLALLRRRNIRLSAPVVKKLRQLRFNQLPPIELATEVKSGADFAERAGLSNGKQ